MNQLTGEFITYMEDNFEEELWGKAEEMLDSECTNGKDGRYRKEYKPLDKDELKKDIKDEIISEIEDDNFDGAKWTMLFLENWDKIDFREVENKIEEYKNQIIGY